jgi:hypothetical protein
MALKSILILPILIVLVSGCTFPGTTSSVETGNGVVIKEFAPLFSEVYSQEPIKFNLKFKNTGSVKAEGVFAEVIGIDNDWYDSSFNVGGPWSTTGSEKFPDQESCRHNGNHADLLPPDQQYGTEGESMTCTWTYKAPKIPDGAKIEYDVWARVFYTYSTTTIKSITAGSQEQIKRYIEDGKSIPVSTVQTTSSPIQLSLTVQEPIRYWEDRTEIPVKIGISNVGGGTPCKEGECKKTSQGHDDDSWNKIMLKISFPEGEDIRLAGGCEEFSEGREVLILPGQENSITCKLELGDLDTESIEQRTIGLSAEYSYFVDQKTTIKVTTTL